MDIRGKQVVYILSCFDIGAGKKGPLMDLLQLKINWLKME
jgi:hypothetical protein